MKLPLRFPVELHDFSMIFTIWQIDKSQLSDFQRQAMILFKTENTMRGEMQTKFLLIPSAISRVDYSISWHQSCSRTAKMLQFFRLVVQLVQGSSILLLHVVEWLLIWLWYWNHSIRERIHLLSQRISLRLMNNIINDFIWKRYRRIKKLFIRSYNHTKEDAKEKCKSYDTTFKKKVGRKNLCFLTMRRLVSTRQFFLRMREFTRE